MHNFIRLHILNAPESVALCNALFHFYTVLKHTQHIHICPVWEIDRDGSAIAQTLAQIKAKIFTIRILTWCESHPYSYSCQIDKIYFPFVHGFHIALKMPRFMFSIVFRNSWLFYICKFTCKFKYPNKEEKEKKEAHARQRTKQKRKKWKEEKYKEEKYKKNNKITYNLIERDTKYMAMWSQLHLF